MEFTTHHRHLGVIPTQVVDIDPASDEPSGRTHMVFDPLIGRRDMSRNPLGQSIVVPWDSDGPALIIQTYQIISLN